MHLAKNHALDLEIWPGGSSLNTVILVASGQNTFGTLAASEVLPAMKMAWVSLLPWRMFEEG